MNNFANALSTIAKTKSLSLQKVLTPEETLSLRNALTALRFPAYTVWATRFNNAKSATTVTVDLAPLYAVAKALCDLIGEVNGAPLHAENVVELIVNESHRVRKIDITPEMAHNHYLRKAAKSALEANPTDENVAEYNRLCDVCKTMENTPGNCKDNFEPQPETTFVTKIARLMGAIINQQQAKSAEQVQAEENERKEAMKARAKARKEAAKKAKAAK
jgi:hypothetical protein